MKISSKQDTQTQKTFWKRLINSTKMQAIKLKKQNKKT